VPSTTSDEVGERRRPSTAVPADDEKQCAVWLEAMMDPDRLPRELSNCGANELRAWAFLHRLAAWTVHVYTSSGLAIGFFALIAAVEGEVRTMFLLIIASCFVDATDGVLARRFDVRKWTPRFDGRKLDDITDYLNYTFVPIFFAYYSGLVPYPWMFACLVVLSVSAFGFCQKSAKTIDDRFTGFPNYWNVLVLYLYLLHCPPLVAAAILCLFSVLVIIPIEYVSAITPPILLPLNTALLAVWLVTLGLIIWELPDPDLNVVYLSLLFPLYHLGLCFALDLRRRLPGNKVQM
jgi:phosphatidylcholine synthase